MHLDKRLTGNEEGAKWLVNNLIKYLQMHKERVERKEITGSTLRNYIKPIKLFCDRAGY